MNAEFGWNFSVRRVRAHDSSIRVNRRYNLVGMCAVTAVIEIQSPDFFLSFSRLFFFVYLALTVEERTPLILGFGKSRRTAEIIL